MKIRDIVTETASAGATGAGSVAAVNSVVGSMIKRPDPSIYSKKKKKVEAKKNGPVPQKPNQNNHVAKHSRNMPGAGSHKTKKDYNRKDFKAYDINKETENESS